VRGSHGQRSALMDGDRQRSDGEPPLGLRAVASASPVNRYPSEKSSDDESGIVQVKFSRHAKRRGALYRIPESTVLAILEEKILSPGIHEIIEKVEGFKYPLKLVVSVEDDIITVITSYPLKKGRNV
jgi:hypothetical protein